MGNVKFKISYDGGKSSYSYSKIKALASDKKIYDTALAFARLRSGEFDSIYKVVTTDITE